MTSDAKVGLLLGLFFIFVIAFIINGLPRFRSDTNSNELTTMANSPNDSYMGSNERKAQEALRRENPIRARSESANESQEATRDEAKVRYKRPLSQDNVAVKDEQVKILIPPDGKWLIERAVELYRLWKGRDMELQAELIVPHEIKPSILSHAASPPTASK